MKLLVQRLLFTGVTAGALAAGAAADTIRFPNDPSVLDARRDLGAKGDGVTDDTAALQRGLEASWGSGGPTKVLFIPNGTYRVTNTLVVRNGIGPWVYGESRDGVVIRLADGAPTNVTSVLRAHPSDTQESSADFFMRNFHNLTIDVGQNPAVDGVRWYGNNSSLLKNVRVIGTGRVGINSGWLGQNGPNLIQDALVEGSFDTGVRCAWSWGQTLSRVTVRNARQVGVYVNSTAVGIEDLVVENTPVALHNEYPNDWTWWGGVVALVGGRFSGGDPNRAAITNTSVLYARDVTAVGFKQVLRSTTPGGSVAGTSVTEYSSHAAKKLFTDSPNGSFKLPVLPEPDFPWETDPANWVCANDHGAKYGDNQDDTAAIQKAIDAAAAAGNTVVYLRGIGGGDPNWYSLDGEVRVHGSVRHIIGLGFGRVIAGANGRFAVNDASAALVKFQNLQAFGGRPAVVENRSATNTLIVEGCDLRVVGAGGGDIFVTDCPSGIELRSPGQRLWARQLNPEGDSDTGLVRNHGGKLWALGVKHEGRGVRFLTDNGGQTEILGLFNYAPDVAANDRRPMFDVDNSPFCAMGVREISFGNTFPVKVREIRNGQVKLEEGGGWIGWPLYSGWWPAQTNGPVAVAWPRLQPDGADFLESINVTATTTTANATLRYTLDGSEPNVDSPALPSPLAITNTAVVKVKGFKDGLAPSATATARFNRLTLRDAESSWIPTNGLTYACYHGAFSRLPNFATLTPRKTGNVATFDLAPRERDTQFAFRYTGYFAAPADGIYTFYLASDDGSRLWIGDTLVVDNDGAHAAIEKAGSIALKQGQHPITVGYFNGSGEFSLTVRYEGPGIAKQPVPASALVLRAAVRQPAGRQPGLEYQYFEGNWTQLPDFDALPVVKSGTLSGFSLSPRRRNDAFAFRYYGWVYLPVDGVWRFYTTSDDGSKLAVGGVEVVDNDGGHAPRERGGTLAALAGYHPLVVTFFEGNGSESLAVAYEGPGVSKRPLPASALFRALPGLVDWGLVGGHLFLTYAKPVVGPAWQMAIDVSDDLGNWQDDPGGLVAEPQPSGFPLELVAIKRLVRVGETAQGFLRLQVNSTLH